MLRALHLFLFQLIHLADANSEDAETLSVNINGAELELFGLFHVISLRFMTG